MTKLRELSEAEALLYKFQENASQASLDPDGQVDPRPILAAIESSCRDYFERYPLAPHVITVKCTGDRTMAVPAIVFGEWAAHPRVIDVGLLHDYQHTVTHVPSGFALQISQPLRRARAVAIARALDRDMPKVQITSQEPPSDAWAKQLVDTVLAVLR